MRLYFKENNMHYYSSTAYRIEPATTLCICKAERYNEKYTMKNILNIIMYHGQFRIVILLYFLLKLYIWKIAEIIYVQNICIIIITHNDPITQSRSLKRQCIRKTRVNHACLIIIYFRGENYLQEHGYWSSLFYQDNIE